VWATEGPIGREARRVIAYFKRVEVKILIVLSGGHREIVLKVAIA
jgi:hypothetical protein